MPASRIVTRPKKREETAHPTYRAYIPLEPTPTPTPVETTAPTEGFVRVVEVAPADRLGPGVPVKRVTVVSEEIMYQTKEGEFEVSPLWLTRKRQPSTSHRPKVDRETFVQLWKAGFNDSQISHKLSCSHSAVRYLRLRLKLPSNRPRGRPSLKKCYDNLRFEPSS